MTFGSPEAARLLLEYLGQRVDKPDELVFPMGADALYGRTMRVINRAGLKSRIDSESRRYALHPHSLRKYFFTNLLASGIDRGIAEGFMGHKFGLDSAYLRRSDDQLCQEYSKALDRFTFLAPNDGGLCSRSSRNI